MARHIHIHFRTHDARTADGAPSQKISIHPKSRQELEQILLAKSKQGGAWVASVAPFGGDATLYQYASPSAIADWHLGSTIVEERGIAVGGKFVPFSKASRIREQNRAISSDADGAPVKSFDFHGLKVCIETPKGGTRSGKDWRVTMPADYGYIAGTKGSDGDAVDAYLGPDRDSQNVYVVDQFTIDGKRFDEHKCMLGFSTEAAAKAAYLAGHHKSGDTFGAITTFTVSGFRKWLAEGDTKKPVAGSAYMAADAEFKESDHPRANNGEFGSGGGGAAAKPPAPSKAGKHLEPAPKDRDSWPAHIKTLKLPPAWTDVHISSDPKSPLQATGKDVKGRTQRVYSKKFAESQSIKKFKRGDNLVKDAPRISQQLAAGRSSKDPKVASHADCAALIMSTGIRPGSDADTGAKVKAYGATTLLGQHIAIDGKDVRMKFVGKKGVALDLPVGDKDIAKMLVARAKAAGPDGRLFGPVTGGSLLGYVHGSLDTGKYKTKDFRTLLANNIAATEIARWKKPESLQEYKKSVLAVAKTVAEKLGNTAAVAIRSYISPAIFEPWKGDLA